jgi:hypothetical protein
MAVRLPAKTTAALIKDISGKTLSLSPNEQFVQSMTFQFKDGLCQVVLKIGADTFQLAFGSGKWAFGQTTKLPPALTRQAKGYFVGLPASKVAGAYRWKDDNTLELTLRYLESPHAEMYTCHFEKGNNSLEYHTSNNNQTLVFKGVLAQNGFERR